MRYRITLNCHNPKDEDKYGRDLHMNNYDAAKATFKALLIATYEELIDGYTIELSTDSETMYKMEKQ